MNSTATSCGVLSNNFSAATGSFIDSSAIFQPLIGLNCAATLPTLAAAEAPATVLPFKSKARNKALLRTAVLPTLSTVPIIGIAVSTPAALSIHWSVVEYSPSRCFSINIFCTNWLSLVKIIPLLSFKTLSIALSISILASKGRDLSNSFISMLESPAKTILIKSAVFPDFVVSSSPLRTFLVCTPSAKGINQYSKASPIVSIVDVSRFSNLELASSCSFD